MPIGRGVIQFLFGNASKRDFSNLYGMPPRSFADEHPEVPKPDHELTPLQIAIRWGCHDLYGEDMPGIACELLEAGADCPSLRRLAGEVNVQCSADVEDIVARVFEELSVPYPISEITARNLLSRQVAREVIAGERNPWAAANHLEIVIWNWQTSDPQVQHIFELNDEIDRAVKYRRSMDEITRDLVNTLATIGARADDAVVKQ